MDLEYVSNLIRERKPNIKDSSIKQYNSSLRNLYRKLVPNTPHIDDNNIVSVNFDHLNDRDKVMDAISSLHITSQRNCLSAILCVIDKGELYDFYGTKVRELNKKQTDSYKNNIVSDNTDFKLQNWTIQDIENCIVKLKLEKNFQTSLLLSLIYKYLFRNEVSSLKLIKKKDYVKLTEEEKLSANYIVKHYSQLFISRGVYKTDKKHGLVLTTIDDKKLKYDILEYIKTMDDDIFFKDENGNQMSNELVSKKLSRATAAFKDVENKDPRFGLGTSSINKIVIESLQLEGVEKLLEISGNRGTSIGTLLHAYYNNHKK